jgi:NACHT domain
MLTVRSIAINDLKNRFPADRNVQVIHLYFDYKSQQSQTVVDIAINLLKQLLSRLDNIPNELDSLYCANTRPDLPACKRLLTLCSKQFGTIFAVFDAIDECCDSYRKELLALFAHLLQSGCKLLISSRPHLLRNLRDQLSSARTIEVYANESDLRNYITVRLREKGNKDTNLEVKCLELATGVYGM